MPPPLQAEVLQVDWEAGVVLQVGFLVAGQPLAGRHRGAGVYKVTLFGYGGGNLIRVPGEIN